MMFEATGGFYNIRVSERTLTQDRNENEAHLMLKDFIDFQILSDFWRNLDFFIMLKASS